MIYFTIFFSKIIENTLATLRIILVSNGKKKLGAILQGMVATLWVISASIIIINIKKNIIKIICFILGSLVGSYMGSLLEEKIAIGTNLLIISTNKKRKLYKNFKEYKPVIFKNNIIIKTKRQKIQILKKRIKRIDTSAKIIGIRIKNI